jgi:hypothetical protein
MLTPNDRPIGSTNRADRRTALRSFGIVGMVGLTGCLESVRSEADGETIIWNGEAYEHSLIICGTSDERATHDIYVSDSSLIADPEHLGFWVQYYYEEHSQVEEPGYRVLLHIREVTGSDGHEQYVAYIAESQVEDAGFDTFNWEDEDRHTSGTVQVEPDNELAEEATPDGGEVEWRLAC